MSKYVTKFRQRFDHEQGATMVEYALIVVVIALVVVLGAAILGSSVSSLFSSIGNNL